MLDSETKRRIDTARDILVGKVPDPKSQVEQITIALIYKFMDDMDAKSEELGGTRNFFAGEFARFGWPKLMRSGLGGHEMLNVYAEAIDRMPENPGIPLLFRDIFNNAYLPYRDPETLRAFLKVINEFTYDHSERLGDAFEYLLSVLGSQGDAGQFRTPRHIIDFIVAVIDPKKNETILDPACGTAGFLISSYKHIVEANTDSDGNSTLTPDEREKLTASFKGYDISPDMVRLSLVNMYLHGFQKPHIVEYDTLTSEERWNEYADVILANPPFMSPKGGIRPHNRFSVKSKRSEVLFVDYMAEHLTPSGRAGIIVPEGIVFQSQNAHKQLRKMLVEDYLVAFVSLPAGVFNPYSGVKTSILILDKALAKRTDQIAFFKVENDGFDLGAQRRPIDLNDLPRTQEAVKEYMGNVGNMDGQDGQDKGEPPSSPDESILEQLIQQGAALIAKKDKIAENGEYNLSGERYRDTERGDRLFPLVEIGDSKLFRVESGGTPKSSVEEYWDGGVPWVTLIDLPTNEFVSQICTTQRTISDLGLAKSSAKLIPENSVIVSTRATIGRIGINKVPLATNQGFKNIVINDRTRAMAKFVAYSITKLVPTMINWASGGTFKELSKSRFRELRIPLPPLEVQREIVAEIEEYQRVIDGARAVIDNYRPHIPIDPDWEMVELGDAAELTAGYAFKSTDMAATQMNAKDRLVVKIANIGRDGRLDMNKAQFHPFSDQLTRFQLHKGDVVVAMTGATVGKVAVVEEDGFLVNQRVGVLRAKSTATQTFVFSLISADGFYNYCQRTSGGGAQGNIAPREILKYKIPLPSIVVQHTIVAEIEAERSLIDANIELIERIEKKIQATIGRVWGEQEHGQAG